MGELEGRKSAWAYVEGGMGKLSQAIADSAISMGATILTNKVQINVRTLGRGGGGYEMHPKPIVFFWLIPMYLDYFNYSFVFFVPIQLLHD